MRRSRQTYGRPLASTNQAALLQIAKLPTHDAQLKAVKEIAERKCAERASRAADAAASDRKAAAKLKTIKSEIGQKEKAAEAMAKGLADDRKKLTKLEDQLVEGCADAATGSPIVDSPPTAPADSYDHAEEQPLSAEDQAAFSSWLPGRPPAPLFGSGFPKRFGICRTRFEEITNEQ